MLSNMIAYAMTDYIDIDAGICSFDNDSFQTWLAFVGSFPETVDSNLVSSRMTVGTWVSGIYEYLEIRDDYSDRLTFVGFPNDSATGPCLQTLTSVGISSQTNDTALCWDFVKLMLSQEYQEIIQYSAFPMRKSVFQAQLEACMLPADNSDSLIRKRVYAEPFSQQEADYLMTLVSGLSASAFRYQDVEEIITEEAEDSFSGGKSAAEVIRVIQNRCAIYLEEKK
jgi:ABC-type glycerol-3-phosphate transport system substrate-binding protein